MKKYTLLILLFTVFIVSCKTVEVIVPVDFSNYEVEALEQGKYGTVLMKVYSYDYSVDNAIQRAKMDAIHALIFKGVPGSNSVKPIDKEGYRANENYYNNFFGLYNIKITEKKLRAGKFNNFNISQTFNAPYRNYVVISNDGTINPNDRLRVGNKFKVGVMVSVNIHDLRKKLENDKIINKLDSGF